MIDESSDQTSKLDEIKSTFRDLDVSDRLEVLLEYSENLPDLPQRFQSKRQAEENRVHECQTPVYLWIEVVNNQVAIYAEVPRESPTVRGFISLLVSSLSGAAPSEVLALKPSLLRELGLAEALGMVRTQGLQAILQRIKLEIKRAVGEAI
ncbi:SufE family protein [Pirellulaceae bacterium SH449]